MIAKNGRPIKLISGSSNRNLSLSIAHKLNSNLSPIISSTFSDGECRIEINDNMRGCDVFVIQTGAYPINHHIIELYLILDALKRSNCWKVTCVLPYLPYARQDKKIQPRVPISAKAIADLITLGGVDRILSMDLHSSQIQGFFNCPVDNLFGSLIFSNEIASFESQHKNRVVLLSPDTGGTDRVFKYAKQLNIPMATTFKKRDSPNEIADMMILGDVKEKHVIIIDDMVDTAGTLCTVADLAMKNKAIDVQAFATHAVLSGNAASKIQSSKLFKVTVTDTIPLRNEFDVNHCDCECNKIIQISTASVFAKAINNIHRETSVSELFK